MKRIVGISLGSSSRDHRVTIELLGATYQVERVGTDGDLRKMIEAIGRLDGEVDAFGLGGMDLYIYAVDRRYEIRDARRVSRAAVHTPIVDGSGLKNTLERRAVAFLAAETDLLAGGKKVLLLSAMDRLGMAQAFEAAGCSMLYGDLPFVLGLPLPLTSLQTLARLARFLAPPVCLLPFKMIYPTGERQKENRPRYARYFHDCQVIAGDFHFIHRYMPLDMEGKIIVTNTVTTADLETLRQRGVKTLVTTTPEMEGRSFGTNVMEALLVAMAGGKGELSEKQYGQLLEALDFRPRIVSL